MPKKKDPDATFGEKLIRLFADLLFTGKPRTQKELSKMLNCSPQTVRLYVDRITAAHGVRINEKKKGKTNLFWIERPEIIHAPPISTEEITVLEMGQAFSRHLIGERISRIATRGLQKAMGMLPPDPFRSCSDRLGSLSHGHVDYKDFSDTLTHLAAASAQQRVCKIWYKRLGAETARDFHIMPLKIFSCKDSIYIHSRRCTEDGAPRPGDTFDPLLALQRFEKVKVRETTFTFPADFDFEKSFARSFGVMKDTPFKVRVNFTGWSADFVSERTWSPDQRIVRKRGGGIDLEFWASSETEVIAWVLSFGDGACLVKPEWLRKKVLDTVRAMAARYGLEGNHPPPRPVPPPAGSPTPGP